MSAAEIIILSFGLAMDAFAVSICKGLSVRKMELKHGLLCGLYFGVFQALMPAAGCLLGMSFKDLIADFDHWVAFVLLVLIGLSMIKESREESECNPDFGIKTMVLMAVATSIDALAVGVSFAFLNVAIVPAVLSIGIITFVLSFAGVKIGNTFGVIYKSKAELAGGIILILIGTKILLEHTGIINF